MTRQNCVYCGKEITQRSREHVIQNALGGLYESTDICCPQCNNYISKYIDAPFTKIFNPIISKIDNFSKTNNTKSLPPCTGKVLYQGNLYNANIKGGRVVGCPELSRLLRCDATKLPLQIMSYDFNLNNSDFQNGMAKIAFNYAIDRGIDFNVLKPGLNVKKSGDNITSIQFNHKILPFCALNPLDLQLELHTPFTLYHSMILFGQNNKLWCYVDLFNTFQYYVLLSDQINEVHKVYSSYAQTLQKPDRTKPKLDIHRPKDISIYAIQYGVEPCADVAEFSRRVYNAIDQKSQKTSINNIISPKIQSIPLDRFLMEPKDMRELLLFGQSMKLYFNEYDQLNTNAFRTMTYDIDARNVVSYPEYVNYLFGKDTKYLKNYTRAKFEILNYFLCQKQK